MADTLQKRAHDLLITIAEGLDPAPDAVYPRLHDRFNQPGSIIVIERPRATGRENFANDRVLVSLEIRMSFLAPFAPHSQGHDDGMETVDALRDRMVVAVESFRGNGLVSIGTFSWQHTWTFEPEYYVVGNNLLATSATLGVTCERPRSSALLS